MLVQEPLDLDSAMNAWSKFDRRASASKDSPAAHLGMAFSAMALHFATQFEKELKKEFASTRVEKPNAGATWSATSAVNFEIEKERAKEYGFPPQGWVNFTVRNRPGDNYVMFEATVLYGNDNRLIQNVMLNWGDGPNELWGVAARGTVDAFYKYMSEFTQYR